VCSRAGHDFLREQSEQGGNELGAATMGPRGATSSEQRPWDGAGMARTCRPGPWRRWPPAERARQRGERAGGAGMRALVLGGGGRRQGGRRRDRRRWPASGGPAVADVGLTGGGLADGGLASVGDLTF
jgi:hypothetical protein